MSTQYFYRSALIGAVLLVFFGASLQADTVYMRNGRTVEGRIIGQSRQTVRLHNAAGMLLIPKRNIRRIKYGAYDPEAAAAKRRAEEEKRKREEDQRKRQETERKEAERKEAERKEAERKEAERKEAERKQAQEEEKRKQEEIARKKAEDEKREEERKRQEAERQETERKEAERKEAERKKVEEEEKRKQEEIARDKTDEKKPESEEDKAEAERRREAALRKKAEDEKEEERKRQEVERKEAERKEAEQKEAERKKAQEEEDRRKQEEAAREKEKREQKEKEERRTADSDPAPGVTRWGALWRSALIPGWGQISSGRKGIGITYGILALGGLGAAYDTHRLYLNANRDLSELNNPYSETSLATTLLGLPSSTSTINLNDPLEAYLYNQTFADQRAAVDAHYANYRAAAYFYGALYLWNLIDAVLFHPGSRSTAELGPLPTGKTTPRSGPRFTAAPTLIPDRQGRVRPGLHMSLEFRF